MLAHLREVGAWLVLASGEGGCIINEVLTGEG